MRISQEAVSLLFEFHSRAVWRVPPKGIRFFAECCLLHVRAGGPETLPITASTAKTSGLPSCRAVVPRLRSTRNL